MDPAEPFDDAGLLEGLSGAARAERTELLQWLDEVFRVPIQRMRRSTDAGTIVLTAAGMHLGTEEIYSARAIAAQTGVDPDFLTDLLRAAGLPAPIDIDEAAYGPTHMDAAAVIKKFQDGGVRPEQLVDIARVLGRGFAQAADLMRQTVMELSIAPRLTERDLAIAYAAVAEGLSPLLSPLLDQMMRMHLHNAARDEVVTETERREGALPGARDTNVAFADLVGFTKLGEQLPPEELERVAERLVVITADVIAPPVRLVKSVGDAVLLVSPDADALLRAAFAILEQLEELGDDYPQVRIGLSHGPAVARAGDWFGRPVNLASRITGVARAGSIVTDAAFQEQVGENELVRWSKVGDRRLKNVQGSTRLFRARPAS